MRRAALVTVLALPLLAVLAVAAFVVAGRFGDGSAAPGRGASAAPDGTEELLRRGGVVIETDARSDLPALRAAAARAMGLPAYVRSPARRRGGDWIEVRHDDASEGIVVYADDGIIRVASPEDVRLRDFLATSLGPG